MDLTLVSPKDAKGKELLHTTSEHPFLTQEKSFTPAGQLHVGMHVRKADGTWGVVAAVKVVNDVQVMYNLEVAQDHTFVVGDGQWVVHNVCGSTPGGWRIGPYSQLSRDISGQVSPNGLPYQAHHIFQNAMMKGLPGYGDGANAPAVALEGGSAWRGSPHYEANLFQANFGKARRFLNRVFGFKPVTFDEAKSVADDSLTVAGVSATERAYLINNYASPYFTSRWTSTQLNNLRVPG